MLRPSPEYRDTITDMSDFPPTAGGGAWLDPHSSGAATPNQSPHTSGMRNMPTNTPFQCGICYEYLSNSVDDLDEHIMKHKRELAERLEQQAQPSTGTREAAYINQNHQQSMVYYSDGTHVGTQAQVYEYPAQSCTVSAQQFDEARQRSSDFKTASRYYAHHPTLLHHRQASSTGLLSLYSGECVGRSEANVASSSTQHDDFADGMSKRARYESNPYEREDHHAHHHHHHHHHHAAKPDLNEENTADADPSNEHMKDSEHGPVTFADAQQSDSISYHELQPVKSESASTPRNNDGIQSSTGNFGLDQDESLKDHDSNADSAATMHESGNKSSEIQTTKDLEGHGFGMELTSSTGSPQKDLETPDDGNARSEDGSSKNPEDQPAKTSDVEPSGKIPRTRRSVRVQTGRR